MKKIVPVILALVLCLSLCACGKSEAVEAFEASVVGIGTVSLESESAIVGAEDAYAILSDKEKASASESKELLDTKRAEYDALVSALEEKLNSVVALIDAIGDVTLESETTIAAAEDAFAALAATEQSIIPDAAAKLTSSRDALSALIASQAADVTAAIDAIGTVTIESKDAIATARNLYDALTEEGKALVANIGTLETAEGEISILWEADKQKIIDEYSGKFDIDSDPITGISWYMPKKMPYYIDERSYIIPYIGVNGNNAWICIRYNYTADSWIFWENLTIMADGEKYYKFVSRSDQIRDNDTEVWEYYDEPLNYNQGLDTEQLVMLKAIADSEETIIRFQGDEYYYDLYVSNQDKQMIRETLKLYEAMID